MKNRERQRANRRLKHHRQNLIVSGRPDTVKFIEPQKHKPKGATRNV